MQEATALLNILQRNFQRGEIFHFLQIHFKELTHLCAHSRDILQYSHGKTSQGINYNKFSTSSQMSTLCYIVNDIKTQYIERNSAWSSDSEGGLVLI